MDFVPLAFCASVCAFLDRKPNVHLEETFARVWQAAARENWKYRVIIAMNYDDGVWSYKIKSSKDSQGISFDELQRMNRGCLQVIRIGVGRIRLDPMRKSSLEEIFEIMDFTVPFLKKPSFHIFSNVVPADVLSRMLLRYRNVPFTLLKIYDIEAEGFLMMQLQSNDVLQTICYSPHQNGQLQIARSEELRVAVEEFAISKPFESLSFYCESLVFDNAFFERLFERIDHNCSFYARFSFDSNELEGFKPEIQNVAAARKLRKKEKKANSSFGNVSMELKSQHRATIDRLLSNLNVVNELIINSAFKKIIFLTN